MEVTQTAVVPLCTERTPGDSERHFLPPQVEAGSDLMTVATLGVVYQRRKHPAWRRALQTVSVDIGWKVTREQFDAASIELIAADL